MRLSALLLLALAAGGPLAAQQPRHPLDALTSAEYWAITDVLRAAGRLDTATSIREVTLREAPKAELLAWKPGAPMRREARVVLLRGAETAEATVDLGRRRVLDWRPHPGRHAPWSFGDFGLSGELMLADPRVQAALARRGITDLATLHCYALPLGYFARPEQRDGRRIGRGGCALRRAGYNGMGRLIDGLVVDVDMVERRVVQVLDRGDRTLPLAELHEFTDEALATAEAHARPLVTTLPLGPGLTRAGGEVQWERWRFHVRPDTRAGIVLSLVRWLDEGRERSVLHQGHLSEIFVPYQDSTAGWYDRTFLDGGEYAAEGLAEPLEPGVDCPAHAEYLDLAVPAPSGEPYVKRRVVCLFERGVGLVAWRHGDEERGTSAGRPSRELVVRMNATVGNYDYLFDWIFQQNGSLTVSIGATGVLEARSVASRASGPASAGDERFGRLLAPGLLGVNHDHFFAFRLDLDVDGVQNRVVADRLVRQRLPDAHPRRSLWTVETSVLEKESSAQLDMDMHRPAAWRVQSSVRRGALGRPTSYEIAPGHNAMLLMDDDDWPIKRAGFARHQLWVTPHDPAERWAAGDYPTLSSGGDGLPAWTAKDRSLVDTDVVAWYTLGFHHIPRAEDWPVMPTAWHSFELRPVDFFDRNPALQLPRVP